MKKVNELVTFFKSLDGEDFIVERDEEELEKKAKGGREMDVVHAPDYTDGTVEPPPILYQNDDMIVEFTKQIGPQSIGWHRGADMDELTIQLKGRRSIKSEAGTVKLGPGDMNVIPRGIAHSHDGDKNDEHVIIYTKKPLKRVAPLSGKNFLEEMKGKNRD